MRSRIFGFCHSFLLRAGPECILTPSAPTPSLGNWLADREVGTPAGGRLRISSAGIWRGDDLAWRLVPQPSEQSCLGTLSFLCYVTECIPSPSCMRWGEPASPKQWAARPSLVSTLAARRLTSAHSIKFADC